MSQQAPTPCPGFPCSKEGAVPAPMAGERQQEPLEAAGGNRGNRAAPAAAGHMHSGHCTTIGFAAALPLTAWKLNCKMSKTFPNCTVLARFY